MQVVINKILMHYEFYGDLNKPVVLILHGWRDSIASWVSTAKSLEKNYCVLLLDLPGFGNSLRPKSTYGTFDYALLIQDFLTCLKINKYTVVGHSFGGRIAIVLAAKDSKVDKLVLVDAAGIEPSPTIYNFIISFIAPLKALLPKRYIFLARWFLGSKDYNSAGEMKDIFLKVIKEDLAAILPDIIQPTLIIWGNKDTILDVSLAKRFRSLIKHSRIKIVWGAGHHPHRDKPSDFVEALQENLDDN